MTILRPCATWLLFVPRHIRAVGVDLFAGFPFQTAELDQTVSHRLDSNFVPTCSECSTPFPAPGVVAVRGESAMATCRECHRRMGMYYLGFHEKNRRADPPRLMACPYV